MSADNFQNVVLIPISQTRKAIDYSKYFELDTPLPAEVTDKDELDRFFKKYSFVPYAGYGRITAHRLLLKLHDYGSLSLTRAACIEAKKTYAFGGKVQIVSSADTVFDVEEENEITKADKQAYTQFLSGIKLEQGQDWRTIRENLSDNYDKTGNAWIEIVLSETAGVKSSAVYTHPDTSVLYWYKKIDGAWHAGVSKIWTDEYLDMHPVELIPVFPFFKQMRDGTNRTLLHIKRGDGMYGRPCDYGALLDMFTEHKNQVYLAARSNKGFVTENICEVPASHAEGGGLIDSASAQRAGYKSASDRLEEKMTIQGNDPSPLIVVGRRADEPEIKLHEIKRKLDANFFKDMDALYSLRIARANDIPLKLLDMDGATGFSENMYKQIFEIKTVTTFAKRQALIDGAINKVVHKIAEYMGAEAMMKFSQKSTSPIQRLINEVKDAD